MKTYYIIILIALSFLLPSCKKFLDEKQNSKQAPLNTVEACQAALNNTVLLNNSYPSEAEVYADNYYIPDDFYSSISSAESRDIYTYAKNAQRLVGADQWLSPYQKIYTVNVVLEALDKITAGSAAYNQAKGAALFFRAFNFYQLASIYAKPYDASTANQDMGIPIRLNSDINIKSDRGTVKQTYDQIIKDLQGAGSLLPEKINVIATTPVKGAAYGMLARVYLSMGDYANALTAANEALKLNNTLVDYNTLDVTSERPFTNTNKEALFHGSMTPDFFIDPTYYAKINPELYELYDDLDLRKQILFKSNDDGTYRYTGYYNNPPDYASGLWIGVATDEVFLIRAECYARAGNKELAMADLNTLLSKRYVTGSDVNMAAADANAALTIILRERRKELPFRGLRWMDLKRLNKDPQREITLKRTVNGIDYTLPPNDFRYEILIPYDALMNSSLIQNPR